MKTAGDSQMTNVEALVSMAQVLIRYRNDFTSKAIQTAVDECRQLINKDVYRITDLEKLQTLKELFNKYDS